MKRYFTFLVLLYFAFSPLVYAKELVNTGFIPGQIWYSKEPLIEGETVKIYTAVWNSGASSLSAKIEFYDKNVLLGTRDVVVPSSSLKEVSISWKITSGDHLISAKIISPSITTSGKKEVVVVDSSSTEADRQFVPVVIKTAQGEVATASDVVKSQLDKATSSLDGVLPDSISTPVSDKIGAVDDFRVDTFNKISSTKAETQKRIDELNKLDSNPTTEKTDNKKANEKVVASTKVGVEDATEKPIAYLKLFFFSILSFIFGYKIVFYALIVLILFFILRGVYRKIRNR